MMSGITSVPRERWREPAYVLFYFLGLSIIFYWPIAFAGQILASYDLLVYFYPYRDYASAALGSGELPLWDPYLFMGAPFLANIQAAVLYPFNLLTLWLPAPQAVNLSILVHVFLAGVFMYAFARASLQLPAWAAIASGTVFMFSGFISQQVGHVNQLNAAVWIPLLFLLIDITIRRRSLLAATGGGVVLAVQILAGHPQEVYLSLSALGLYGLFRGAQAATAHFKAKSKFGIALREGLLPLAALAGMGLLATSIAAIQLLPTAELAALSMRGGGLSYAEMVSFSLPPAELLRGLLPAYGDQPFSEFIAYVGFIPLALALVAATRWRSHTHAPFMAALAAVSILFALGGFGPLYPLLGERLPGLNLFRVPARWLFLYTFAISSLAGIGLAHMMQARPLATALGIPLRTAIKRLGIITASVATAILILWLAGELVRLPQGPTPALWALFALLSLTAVFLSDLTTHRRLIAVAIVAVALAELAFALTDLDILRTVPTTAYSEIPAPVSKVLADKDKFRVLSMASPEAMLETAPELKAAQVTALSPFQKEYLLEAIRYQMILAPNLSLSHKIATVDGYDGGILPLKQYVDFKRALLQSGRARPETIGQPDALLRDQLTAVPDAELLGALGVKYVIADRNLRAIDLELIYDGGVKVYRNPEFRPSAYLVHNFVVAERADDALASWAKEPLQTVVFSEPPPRPSPSSDSTAQAKDRLETLSQRSQERRFRAQLSQPGFLVVAETYYPGWRAWVDGTPTDMLRADLLFSAVPLDAGEHLVELRYEPDSFALGWRITLGALITTVALVAYSLTSKLRRRRKNASFLDEHPPL